MDGCRHDPEEVEVLKAQAVFGRRRSHKRKTSRRERVLSPALLVSKQDRAQPKQQ